MLILGIETSCDETAASIVKDGRQVLSSVVSSSLRYHKKFGGVIPEIATRHHVENIDKVVDRSLKDAHIDIKDVDLVAVTQGPGLVGALLCGISFAKALSYSRGIPLLGVDHLAGHIYSAMMEEDAGFPFIGLTISGGHTRLSLFRDHDEHEIIGDTLDDAVGEAYDKVAKILGLEYPGGPIIDRLAKKGNPKAIKFTCRAVKDTFNFSFSGIKTAVLYYVRDTGSGIRVPGKKVRIEDIAASFQESVLQVIVKNSIKALEEYKIKKFVIGGGVSANSRFRELIKQEFFRKGFKAYFPPLKLCSDNGAMIAGLAYHLYRKGKRSPLDITANI
ncbi:MAG: tRNA (adenosine(37)-N6)-threonylcarbamoyltransferase complex transferase subunit TsaD [Candidatus Omnitrophota bacterium]